MTGTEIMEIATATAGHYWGTEAHLIAFAREISKVERERCAKVCEGMVRMDRHGYPDYPSSYAEQCAAAIRGTK